jgi:hypothetical protein
MGQQSLHLSLGPDTVVASERFPKWSILFILALFFLYADLGSALPDRVKRLDPMFDFSMLVRHRLKLSPNHIKDEHR